MSLLRFGHDAYGAQVLNGASWDLRRGRGTKGGG
jgi:hypothetical protein